MVLTGRSFSSAIVFGLPFISTLYSSVPSFAVPVGRIRFCAFTVFTMSIGDSPFDCSAVESISTETTRDFPPYGNGIEAPGTVEICVRMKLFP